MLDSINPQDVSGNLQAGLAGVANMALSDTGGDLSITD